MLLSCKDGQADLELSLCLAGAVLGAVSAALSARGALLGLRADVLRPLQHLRLRRLRAGHLGTQLLQSNAKAG